MKVFNKKNGLMFGLLLMLMTAFLSARAEEGPDRNPWNPNWRVGMFLHFLPGGDFNFHGLQFPELPPYESFFYLPGWHLRDRLINNFDVEGVADQIASTGADYFVLTMSQNGGWFNGPNVEYDRTLGYEEGYRTAKRDLPMEMADALAKRNISFFLYITAEPPCCDANAQQAFGFSTGLDDQKNGIEQAEKWSRVLSWWSCHYRDKVAGWWIDTGYAWCDFNEEIAKIYRDALREGNPNAVVAFNPGVKEPEWLMSDYTAGETYEPFEETGTDFSQAENRKTQKGHILTFLGEDWGSPGLRSVPECWIPWGRKIVATGTALTFDLGLNQDGDQPGYFSEEALAVVRGVAESVDEESKDKE